MYPTLYMKPLNGVCACSVNVLQFIPRFWKESIIVFAVFSQMDCSLDSTKIIKTLLMQKLGVKPTRKSTTFNPANSTIRPAIWYIAGSALTIINLLLPEQETIRKVRSVAGKDLC